MLRMDLGNDVKMEGVKVFCYLGEGTVSLMTVARVRCAWNKCQEMSSILMERGRLICMCEVL